MATESGTRKRKRALGPEALPSDAELGEMDAADIASLKSDIDRRLSAMEARVEDGMGSLEKRVSDFAERLATHGYFVLLPDLYYRSGPYEPMDPHRVFADAEQRKTLMTRFNAPGRSEPPAIWILTGPRSRFTAPPIPQAWDHGPPPPGGGPVGCRCR